MSAIDLWCRRLESQDRDFVELVVMSFRKLSEQDLKRLFMAIAPNQHLRTLSLCGQRIDSGVVQNLTYMLKNNNALTNIEFGNNVLGELVSLEEFKAVCEAVFQHPALQSWSLDRKGLTEQHAEILAQIIGASGNTSNITSLVLSRNALNDTALRSLRKAFILPFTHVQNLDLSDNKLVHVTALIDLLADERCRLQSLDLSGNPLALDAAKAIGWDIAGNQHMRMVYLNSTRSDECGNVGDMFLSGLASVTPHSKHALTHIGLRDTGVSDTGMSYLSEYLSSLSLRSTTPDSLDAAQQKIPAISLDLSMNSVTDSGLNLVVSTDVVERMNLNENKISAKSYRYVIDSCCVFVHRLDFCGNSWNAFPVDFDTDVFRPKQSVLQHVDLSACQIHLNLEALMAFEQLFQCVSSLKVLELGGNTISEDVNIEIWTSNMKSKYNIELRF